MNTTFAPLIRKQILQALDQHIIPALQNQQPLQILAEPPFDFAGAEHWLVSDELLPDQKIEPSQLIWSWKQEHMVASRMPFLGFVYQGIADERIGLTHSMAESLRDNGQSIPAAITAMRLPAPSVISIPPHTPRRAGSKPYRENDHAGSAPSAILWMHLMTDAVLPHLCSTIDGIQSTHSLYIEDRSLVQMGFIYFDEMRYAKQDQNHAAQGLLLAFYSRLRRYLTLHPVSLSNSSWEFPPQSNSPHSSKATLRNQQLCRLVTDYIDAHLHTQLTLEILARHAGISIAHLSRIFRQTMGITLMHYVTQHRIEAAKGILCYAPERIEDIAKLVGFADSSSFSAVFKRHTGVSPTEFTRRFKLDLPLKSTFHDQFKT